MRAIRSVSLVLSVVVAFAVAGCSSSSKDSGPTLTGDWHGNIEIPDKPLAVGVNFTGDGKATIDVPSQNLMGTPLKDVVIEPDRVEWTIPDLPGNQSFKGSYDKASDSIRGQFTASGQQAALNLTRGLVAGAARPQEPKPPWPYKSEDISYRSGDITIAGTLTEPNTSGPHPAVVLITGSGAQDRNEEILGHKPFLLLADTLTRAGYAVLRTDDRGIGGTGGKLTQTTYDQLADDVAAGITYLHGRSEIDGKRIGLLGHSEGGFIAPLVAARPDSGVAFVIMMAGPAVRGSDVLIEQTRLILAAQGTPQDEIDREIAETIGLVDAYRTGDLDAVRKLAHQYNDSQPAEKRAPDAQVDAQVNPYMAALLNYDPAPALSALRMPVLAFYGTKDLQVPPAQSEGPARTLLAADPDATVHVFDGVDHLMQPAKLGLPSEYATIETTIDPPVLDYVTAWLTQRFPTSH